MGMDNRIHSHPDERDPTGILTSGFKPGSPFPAFRPVGDGVRIPSQWRNRPRFPRGSQTFDRDMEAGRNTQMFANHHPISKSVAILMAYSDLPSGISMT